MTTPIRPFTKSPHPFQRSTPSRSINTEALAATLRANVGNNLGSAPVINIPAGLSPSQQLLFRQRQAALNNAFANIQNPLTFPSSGFPLA
jgi:hypothetical protein